jgi:hypothetical protein
MISHTKAYGIYHWDTFDNETDLIGEADTLAEAQEFVQVKYYGHISPDGADRVDIVDQFGDVLERVSVK